MQLGTEHISPSEIPEIEVAQLELAQNLVRKAKIGESVSFRLGNTDYMFNITAENQKQNLENLQLIAKCKVGPQVTSTFCSSEPSNANSMSIITPYSLKGSSPHTPERIFKSKDPRIEFNDQSYGNLNSTMKRYLCRVIALLLIAICAFVIVSLIIDMSFLPIVASIVNQLTPTAVLSLIGTSAVVGGAATVIFVDSCIPRQTNNGFFGCSYNLAADDEENVEYDDAFETSSIHSV